MAKGDELATEGWRWGQMDTLELEINTQKVPIFSCFQVEIDAEQPREQALALDFEGEGKCSAILKSFL